MSNPTRVLYRRHYELVEISSLERVIGILSHSFPKVLLDFFTEFYLNVSDSSEPPARWRLYRSRGGYFFKCSERLSFPLEPSSALSIDELDESPTPDSLEWGQTGFGWRSQGDDVPWDISWRTFRLQFSDSDDNVKAYLDVSTDLSVWSVVVTSLQKDDPVFSQMVNDGLLRAGPPKLAQFMRYQGATPNCGRFPAPLGPLLSQKVREKSFVPPTNSLKDPGVPAGCFDSDAKLHEEVIDLMVNDATITLPPKWAAEAVAVADRITGSVTY